MEIKEINIRDITGHMDRFHDIKEAKIDLYIDRLTIQFNNGDEIRFNTKLLICYEFIYDEDYINAHE